MFIALGMHVSPVESGKSRMHKYHSTARLGGRVGGTQATGDHASKAVRGIKYRAYTLQSTSPYT